MAKLHYWSKEELDWLRVNYKKYTIKEMIPKFNEHFNVVVNKEQIKGTLKRYNIQSGRTGRFEKGKPSWNKGMKGLNLAGENGRKTQFKKGQAPINYRPVGSERIDKKDGYVLIKVQDEGTWPERWRHKHVVEWEKHHGEVPHNHVVSFLDSDKTNIHIDNLVLLSREELARMNQANYFSNDPDITLSRIMLVRLNNKIVEADFMENDREKFKEHIKTAVKNGIEEKTFKARLRRGWHIQDAVNKPLHYRGLKSRKNMKFQSIRTKIER